MKLILLSGGSGKRLWPLSNDCRSKQFLKVFRAPNGEKESMTQRVVRQIEESGINAEIIIATSINQKDILTNQFGNKVEIVTEPMRRDTFPAIALSCAYIASEKGCDDDEIVVVLPSDQYTDAGYFETIKNMASMVENNKLDLVLMGIEPESPSSNFGYILPSKSDNPILTASRFVEKPDTAIAETLIREGGLWNGGVFAFRLGYVTDIIKNYLPKSDFQEVYDNYLSLPKISFDYEVVEKAQSIGISKFKGLWKDLGSWDALAPYIETSQENSLLANCHNTVVANELDIPVVCTGTNDLVVAASYDGILVTGKNEAGTLKEVVNKINRPAMFEERRWGEFRIIDSTQSDDELLSVTKRLSLKAGKSISYHRHNQRKEIWTIVSGKGRLALDGERFDVGAGQTFQIQENHFHAIQAVSNLEIIEVQLGKHLSEDDVDRRDWEW